MVAAALDTDWLDKSAYFSAPGAPDAPRPVSATTRFQAACRALFSGPRWFKETTLGAETLDRARLGKEVSCNGLIV